MSKLIEAAKKVVSARFVIDEKGTYWMNNYGNEEYVSSCIGELHRELVAAGAYEPLPDDTTSGKL